MDTVRTRRIAIVGFGNTAKACPWEDPSWELWAMNGFWRAAESDYGVKAAEERYTAWFDMHTVAYTREYGKLAGFGDAQERWLEQPHPFPVFMLEESPQFPSVRRFPIEDIIEALGRDYFTSTVAYALTVAIVQGDVAEIGLFGIDLAHESEYSEQRPCAEYWIARAEGYGIKVTIPPGSALLTQRHRYGYEQANPLEDELRRYLVAEHDGLAKVVRDQRDDIEMRKAQMYTNDGALQAFRTVRERLDIWRRGGKV